MRNTGKEEEKEAEMEEIQHRSALLMRKCFSVFANRVRDDRMSTTSSMSDNFHNTQLNTHRFHISDLRHAGGTCSSLCWQIPPIPPFLHLHFLSHHNSLRLLHILPFLDSSMPNSQMKGLISGTDRLSYVHIRHYTAKTEQFCGEAQQWQSFQDVMLHWFREL